MFAKHLDEATLKSCICVRSNIFISHLAFLSLVKSMGLYLFDYERFQDKEEAEKSLLSDMTTIMTLVIVLHYLKHFAQPHCTYEHDLGPEPPIFNTSEKFANITLL